MNLLLPQQRNNFFQGFERVTRICTTYNSKYLGNSLKLLGIPNIRKIRPIQNGKDHHMLTPR